ncbi:CerR family C-terminal domain-containing protein [Chitinimonas sp.]|uniref:CerR family C-terminal domain-containing protein n=1 Tax=Chitinimonas sp. TaxID=1934313 RepID=UPI0035AD9868
MFANPSPPKHIVGDETRQALLDAATTVFLAEGFRAARVKDIAAAAGVRLSAINYHFGGKEGLYLAVLQYHARLALQHSPLPQPDAGKPLEQRFREFVRAMVVRMLDASNPSRIASLMVREAASPTPALDVMFETFSKPQSAVLLGMLAELFGPAAAPDLLARCGLSVVGQSMVYVGMRPLVSKLRPDFYQRPEAVAELAEHIATFSWAGLSALAQIERSKHAG